MECYGQSEILTLLRGGVFFIISILHLSYLIFILYIMPDSSLDTLCTTNHTCVLVGIANVPEDSIVSPIFTLNSLDEFPDDRSLTRSYSECRNQITLPEG